MKKAIIFAILAVSRVSISITTISAQSQSNIPSWVKTNALWWGQGQISDADYLQGLQFLIENNFLKIPSSGDSEYVEELEKKLESAQNLKERYQQGMIELKEENERLQKTLNEIESSSYQYETYPSQQFENYPSQQCYGSAGCYTGHVSKVIDGDTIEVDGVSVRLVLVDTPEYGEYGYDEAGNYIRALCPVGSPVLIDVDDWQESDRYGRILGVVYCDVWNQ